VIVLNQARPIPSFPETTIRTLSAPWFSDVENQESSRPQGSMCLAKQPTKRGSTIPLIEQIVEAFSQGGDGGARWEITVEKGGCPKGTFRHTLACQSDHSRGKVDTEHAVSRIRKPSCP
jgi:hypothetical protein